MTHSASRKSAQQTAERIERAAIDLALERGFAAVTVDMICAAAGVSQRTFFNHFRTKEAVLLGGARPVIDQSAARAFVLSSGPILLEAVGLVRLEDSSGPLDPELAARRFRAIVAEPTLVARQMEHMSGIETELVEIFALRLRLQAERAGESVAEAELLRRAQLLSHLVGGLMMYLNGFQRTAGTSPLEMAARFESLPDDLAALLPKLG